MAKITFHEDSLSYDVDTRRNMDEHQPGELFCCCHPFFGVPLRLTLKIYKDGRIGFHSWEWVEPYVIHNPVLHTCFHTKDELENYQATQEQIDTVSGLFSGRIDFEGIRLCPGATLQRVCPIDLEREEKLVGRKIYLA